jgi:hypothetical protein
LELSLHPKQGEAFLSPASEVLYGGAAGGGKSHLLRVAAIAWCVDVAGLQVYLFRRTFPELFKNHMEGPGSFSNLLGPWLAGGLVKINHSKGLIAFANGARIHLCHCQHRKDLRAYQGAEIHVLMIDELTQWPRDMYAFLRGRVRLAGITVPERWRGRLPAILAGANPGGIGHAWVKAAFIDMAPPMQIMTMAPDEGGMTRQFIPARLEDNPTLLNQDPDYEARLEGLGDVSLVRALRHGDWDIVAGGVFDDLWARKTHVIPAFRVPKTWRIDRSFDWGSARPFSVGWWAESDGSDYPLAGGGMGHSLRGDLFRIAEWYGWSGRPNEGCRMLARDIAKGILEREAALGLTVRPGPADSSIFDKENGNCIAEDMARAGVTWIRAEKGPGSRKQGWQKLRALLQGAKTREAPGLFVFETCLHFIRTLPVLPRSEVDPDDADSAAEDHIADETRYRIYAPKRALQRVRVRGL